MNARVCETVRERHLQGQACLVHKTRLFSEVFSKQALVSTPSGTVEILCGNKTALLFLRIKVF